MGAFVCGGTMGATRLIGGGVPDALVAWNVSASVVLFNPKWIIDLFRLLSASVLVVSLVEDGLCSAAFAIRFNQPGNHQLHC